MNDLDAVVHFRNVQYTMLSVEQQVFIHSHSPDLVGPAHLELIFFFFQGHENLLTNQKAIMIHAATGQ